jgi:hypothetical protein
MEYDAAGIRFGAKNQAAFILIPTTRLGNELTKQTCP